MGKDSFILYDAYDEQIKILSDEQAGVLVKAIYAYRHGRPLPGMDGFVSMAFSFIRGQLDRDASKYAETCEKRKAAGKVGATLRWGNIANDSKCYQTIANATKCKQKMANIADNEYEYEYEYDNDIIKEKDNKLSKKKSNAFPTLEQVKVYAEQRGRADLAQPFYDYFNAGDWKDSNGKLVKNWKQKFVTWETHNERKEEQTTRKPKAVI